ncbi:hypothetical protein [Mesorhizobium carmichaelinearum]|uniref:hypothetical protein n=1 Tax=Mesorhizobium carmichaelinearum TaxID=1208188 RepID=UPI000BA4AFF2|nr:hypothetical protein [Mesorhizobium carmichaelinearum]
MSYSVYGYSKAAATSRITAEWIKTAATLPTAAACFDFAKQLDDTALAKLFELHAVAFSFNVPNAEDELSVCLGEDKIASDIARDQALKIRIIIMTKLVSFEASNSVSFKEGYPEILCNAVASGFNAGQKQLLERIVWRTAKPVLFQDVATDFKDTASREWYLMQPVTGQRHTIRLRDNFHSWLISSPIACRLDWEAGSKPLRQC